MIEDENKDIEDPLKKKKPWKGIFKGILAFLMIGTAYFLMNIHSGYVIVGFILICLSSTLMIPQLNQEENNRHTISISVCENLECALKIVQDYKAGDFIFKMSGSCSKCGSNLKINEIYSLKIVKKNHQKRKKKNH